MTAPPARTDRRPTPLYVTPAEATAEVREALVATWADQAAGKDHPECVRLAHALDWLLWIVEGQGEAIRQLRDFKADGPA